MKDNWKLEHAGFIVRDMEKAVQYYQSIGAVTLFPLLEVASSTERGETYGKPANPRKSKLCCMKIGNLVLELIQPVEGESLQMEFLQKYGEGINHLSFCVDDLENETSEMVEKGFQAIHTMKLDGKLEEVYFDTREAGNVIIALNQGEPKTDAKSWASFLGRFGLKV